MGDNGTMRLVLFVVWVLVMADGIGFADLAAAADPAEMTTDYLGNPVAVSFKGQPALPTGGPVAAGAAPVSTAQGMTPPTPATTGGVEGATTQGGAGQTDLQKAQLALGLAQKAAGAGKTLLGGDQPSTGRDEQAFQQQRAGERQDLSALAPQKVEAGQVPSFGEEGLAPDPSFATVASLIPPAGADAVTAAGAFAGETGGVESVTAADTAASAAATESAVGGFMPYVAPIIQSVGTGIDIAQRSQTGMDPGEQAAFAATDLLTQGIPVFGGAIAMGLGALWNDLWKKFPSPEQRNMADLGVAGGIITNTLPGVAAAGDYTALAEALTPLFKSRYQGNPYALMNGVGETSYNMGAEGMLDLPSRESMAQLFAGNDPNAISFNWQQGIRPEDVNTINTFLNTAVRRQVGLIRAAQAGNPQAQAALSQAQQAQAQEQAYLSTPAAPPTPDETFAELAGAAQGGP
jgi:hypothetical protein